MPGIGLRPPPGCRSTAVSVSKNEVRRKKSRPAVPGVSVSGDPAAVQDDRIENTVIREGPGAVLRTQDVRTVFVTDQVLVVGGQQVQRDAGGLRHGGIRARIVPLSETFGGQRSSDEAECRASVTDGPDRRRNPAYWPVKWLLK